MSDEEQGNHRSEEIENMVDSIVAATATAAPVAILEADCDRITQKTNVPELETRPATPMTLVQNSVSKTKTKKKTKRKPSIKLSKPCPALHTDAMSIDYFASYFWKTHNSSVTCSDQDQELSILLKKVSLSKQPKTV